MIRIIRRSNIIKIVWHTVRKIINEILAAIGLNQESIEREAWSINHEILSLPFKSMDKYLTAFRVLSFLRVT